MDKKKKHSEYSSIIPQVSKKEDAGYCTFLLDYVSNDQSNDKVKISKKIKRKVYGTKAYISQNQKDHWRYLYQRELRRIKMEETIQENLSNWTEEECENYRQRHFDKESQYLRLRRIRTTLSEFTILARLGKGGFSDVFLCRKIDTGEILALKRMKKSRFTDRNEVHRIKQEREVMVKSNSQWLAKLKYCFQSNIYLYMAMEFIPGGDIKNLLDHIGSVSENDAKFFFAEMLLAVDALHKLGYIHRDLKPDNFMIDKSGHLKLIDFGLSKEGFKKKFARSSLKGIHRRESYIQKRGWSINANEKKTKTRTRLRKVYSVVGSPEYMAVEILTQSGYNHLVDYWSLGVILFELIYGVSPFGADTVAGVFDKVKNWKEHVVVPSSIDEEEYPVSDTLWSLIKQLICEPEDRLQSVVQIQNHSWFKDFDWDRVREMEPPFIPDLEHDIDTSYFQTVDTSDQSIDLLVDEYSKDHERKLTKVYSYKEDKKTITPKKLKNIVEEEQEKENPKLKFNQSCSKFDFAGFTFKHEDINVMVDNVSPIRSRRNSESSDAPSRVNADTSTILGEHKTPRSRRSSGFSPRKKDSTSPDSKSESPSKLDRNLSIIIKPDVIKSEKRLSRIALSKRRDDRSASNSPRDNISDDSTEESKRKKRSVRPSKKGIIRPKKYETYDSTSIKNEFYDNKKETLDFLNLKKFKRRSEERPRRKHSSEKPKRDDKNYIEMIQKTLRKHSSRKLVGKEDSNPPISPRKESKKKSHSRKVSRSQKDIDKDL